MIYPDDFDEIILMDLDQFATLPRQSQVACCILALEAEVGNGGLFQFFTNSSGLFVPQTLIALAEIGASKTKDLLEKAVGIAYPGGFPTDPEEYDEVDDSDEVMEALSLLDDQFYKYDDPITDLVNKYLSGAISKQS